MAAQLKSRPVVFTSNLPPSFLYKLPLLPPPPPLLLLLLLLMLLLATAAAAVTA